MFQIHNALVEELADSPDLGSGAYSSEGSSPSLGTSSSNESVASLMVNKPTKNQLMRPRKPLYTLSNFLYLNAQMVELGIHTGLRNQANGNEGSSPSLGTKWFMIQTYETVNDHLKYKTDNGVQRSPVNAPGLGPGDSGVRIPPPRQKQEQLSQFL